MASESIIAAMRDYIASCPLMAEFDSRHRHIDWTKADDDNYGIYPDSDDVVSSYVDGTEVRKYVCSVVIRKFACQDMDRLSNSEFMERLQDWFEERTEEDNLPELPCRREAQEITAANAMLTELDKQCKYGTYTMQIILTYER